jgi:drug/metabolite transporter (DMT)-like permease
MKKKIGLFYLVLAALIWGMAFVAQSEASDTIGGFTFNAVRCFIGSLFLFLLLIFKNTRRKDKSNNAGKIKNAVIPGIICGTILFAAMNLQQFGIAAYPADAASSGRSGFITATYVVMIAVFTWIHERHLKITLIFAVAGCTAGMYMLCLSGGISKIYFGDILVFLCAIIFTIYMLLVDSYKNIDGVTLSCIQFFVCAVLSGICMSVFEKPELHALLAAWLPIVYTGVFSTGIAYTLQVVGQKYVEPTAASIAMSLESVFAAISGSIILSERMDAVEISGCILMFASVILSQLPDRRS